jgi:glycosyltransferase involved in cell wall biosynthesis
MGVPTVHTVHDLHPHIGTRYGKLLYLWNGWVRRGADHLLVHGQCYRNELVAQGMPPRRVTCTPLTHLFVGHALGCALSQSLPDIRYEPWALFFARLEAYKGLDVLVEAAWRLDGRRVGVVIAGPGRMRGLGGSLPDHIDVRDRLIGDEEAVDLFRRCGLVVLPYSEASQSALIAAAYYFRKPVIVTRAGALPEYVMEGETGWVIPARNPSALAERLQRALNDPEQLAHMGRAGRAWYDQQRQAEGLGLQEMYVELVRPLLRAQAAAQREG